jgi:hypothetical protein
MGLRPVSIIVLVMAILGGGTAVFGATGGFHSASTKGSAAAKQYCPPTSQQPGKPKPPSPAKCGKVPRCKVPKLRNKNLKVAKQRLRRAHCRYRIRGKGRVVRTRPRAGKRTTRRVIVRAKRLHTKVHKTDVAG